MRRLQSSPSARTFLRYSEGWDTNYTLTSAAGTVLATGIHPNNNEVCICAQTCARKASAPSVTHTNHRSSLQDVDLDHTFETRAVELESSESFRGPTLQNCTAVSVYLSSTGGSYPEEISVKISTLPRGTGVVVWAQDGRGPLQAQEITLPCNNTIFFITAFDSYGDGWNGAKYSLVDSNSTVRADNGGRSPDADGAIAGWEMFVSPHESYGEFVIEFDPCKDATSPCLQWSDEWRGVFTFMQPTSFYNSLVEYTLATPKSHLGPTEIEVTFTRLVFAQKKSAFS